MKTILLLLAAAAVVVVLAGIWFWHQMGKPLYEPGMVAAGKNLSGPLEPPRQTGDGLYWQVQEAIRLAYHAHGEGRPVLVVHGGPGVPIHEPLAGLESLTADFRFYYYDQRGCGKSTRPLDRFESKNYYANMTKLEQTLGIGAQVSDIERIRRILGQEKLILLGHSFGAFLAAMYAVEFPDHVDGMVLVAPAGVLVIPDERSDLFGRIGHHLPSDQQAEYDRFLEGYLDFGSVFSKSEAELARMNRQLGDYFLQAAGQTIGPPTVDSDRFIGGWMVHALYFSMGKRHDYRDALRRAGAPVLIIHGQDDIVPQHVSRMYAEALPNARLRVLASATADHVGRVGHFVFQDQPEAFAEAVGEFLAGL